MINDIPMTFVDVITKMNDSYSDASSLPEYVEGTRNDFLTLIESKVAELPEAASILGVANTLVASYYLSAFTLHLGLPGVDIRGNLDKFAVARSPLKSAIKFAISVGVFALGAKVAFGRESYVGTMGAPGDFGKILATEGFKASGEDEEKDDKKKEHKPKPSKNGMSVTKQDMARQISEGGDLSTGKIFDLEIVRDGNTMPLSLSIGLSVLVAEKEGMKSILSVADYEYSFDNRTMLASAGARSWIRDIALSRDLIDQMRKNRHADKTGFYKTVVATRNKNWISSLFGNVSINNASSVIIVSQETVDEVESILGGPLTDFNIRSRIFKDTLTMLIFVVDQRWDTVTIFHRGLNRYTELRMRDINSSKGGNNMDVNEIIRAYQAGNAPLGR